ncbi:MAG: dihydrolipoamide acetyltransferase family protein [Armatimonadetes bacterium]|nr:dihydrolipoamide acetyltransferase family protein [Armatimonadota bacterium]
MAIVFNMPMLGNTMEEGTILQWFKKEGDAVKAGEPLLEVMSDKANFEVEAPADGTVLRIIEGADAVVNVHAPIAVIGAEGESADVPAGDAPAAPAAEAPAAGAPDAAQAAAESAPAAAATAPVAISPRARRLADELGIAASALAGKGSGPGGRVIEEDVKAYAAAMETVGTVKATPLAAKIAEALGVPVGSIPSSDGKVRADDVRKFAEGTASPAPAPAPAAAPAAPAGSPAIAEVIPFKGLRKMTADVVTKSRFTAPHITLNMEVDMTECIALREKLVPVIQKTHETKVTVTDVLVKAVARALKDHPLCNAALVGDEIRLYADRNIGVAVATATGLVVPVIRGAENRSLGEISLDLKALVARARDGKQTQEDMSGGTFTITNIGMFGVDSFDPIIVPPQSCILGVCRTAEKPVVRNGQVVIRSMMNLSLSLDHRVLDGAPGAKFLLTLKELLESPLSILA